MTATLEIARPAHQHQGQIDDRMPIAFTDAATVVDDHMIQQGAITIRCRSELFQIVGKHLGLQGFNPDHLLYFLGISGVMGQRVVCVGNSDFRVRSIRLFAADHESNHPREIGLEGQNLQVKHQPGVFLECGGNAGRSRQRWQISGAFLFRDLDATLNITNGVEILGNLGAIART